MATQSSLSAGQAAAFPASIDIRLSNALAYRIVQGPFSASAIYALGEGSATTGRMIGVMAMYRTDTDVNAVLTHFNNKGLGQAAPGQAGFLCGVTASAGTDSNSVALGLRHRF